jgi:tetratricopeptide (TPR) repeat protein
MRPVRVKIPDQIREQLFKAQNGRCALCELTHPINIHHIIPVSNGGKDAFENLVLLCQNHHDLADSGMIAPEILQYYKRIAPSNLVKLEDPTFIYEVSIDRIVKELIHHYDSNLLSISTSLFQRLQRSLDIRYQRLCVELLFGIIYTSMNEVDPDIKALKRYANKALKIADGLGEEGLRYHQLITHNMGVLYHKTGRYNDSKAAFEAAVKKSELVIQKNEVLEADKNLALVRETASDHLQGYSNRSLDHLRFIIEHIPENSETFAGTYCFSQIKLAEHMIVRRKYEDAIQILEITRGSPAFNNVLPLYQIILFKDLGKTYFLSDSREKGVGFLIKAYGISEFCGFKDQCCKILEIAQELNISTSEIKLDN